MCRNTAHIYMYMGQENFLHIYMCRNTACTYKCAGILPAHLDVQEYFLHIIDVQEYFLHIYTCTWGRKISCTSCAGILPANNDVQEYVLHIYMCRNTACTYRYAGMLPAHIGVYTHV